MPDELWSLGTPAPWLAAALVVLGCNGASGGAESAESGGGAGAGGKIDQPLPRIPGDPPAPASGGPSRRVGGVPRRA